MNVYRSIVNSHESCLSRALGRWSYEMLASFRVDIVGEDSNPQTSSNPLCYTVLIHKTMSSKIILRILPTRECDMCTSVRLCPSFRHSTMQNQWEFRMPHETAHDKPHQPANHQRVAVRLSYIVLNFPRSNNEPMLPPPNTFACANGESESCVCVCDIRSSRTPNVSVHERDVCRARRHATVRWVRTNAYSHTYSHALCVRTVDANGSRAAAAATTTATTTRTSQSPPRGCSRTELRACVFACSCSRSVCVSVWETYVHVLMLI